jgi:hypothetical protein
MSCVNQMSGEPAAAAPELHDEATACEYRLEQPEDPWGTQVGVESEPLLVHQGEIRTVVLARIGQFVPQHRRCASRLQRDSKAQASARSASVGLIARARRSGRAQAATPAISMTTSARVAGRSRAFVAV